MNYEEFNFKTSQIKNMKQNVNFNWTTIKFSNEIGFRRKPVETQVSHKQLL